MSSAKIERSHVAVVPSGESPLRSIPVPAVAANVSYVHGVTGGNIFVMTRLGVRRLAAAMMGMDADGGRRTPRSCPSSTCRRPARR